MQNIGTSKVFCFMHANEYNGRNRMMYIALKSTDFKEIGEKGGISILENDFSRIQQSPEYVGVVTDERVHV